MADDITLFDWGTLGLVVAWGLGLALRRRPGSVLRRAVAPLILVSAGLMAAGLAWRGALTGHWPLITAYEFCLAFVTAIVLVYLVIGWRTEWFPLGLPVLPIAVLLAAYARWGIPESGHLIAPLVPALRSGWLPIHVLTAALAYGCLAVAGGAALGWWLSRQPDDRQIFAGAMEQAVLFGYPWMTASLVSGMIWAQMAWGNYWSWDAKEVWALAAWLIYTLFIHARYRRKWAGQRLAVLALIGFAVALFTFWGVGPLVRWAGIGSMHVF